MTKVRRALAGVVVGAVAAMSAGCSSFEEGVRDGVSESATETPAEEPSPSPTDEPTGEPTEELVETPSETPTVEPTEEPTPEVVVLDPADLLVQRDEGGPGSWEADEPSPGDAKVSTNWPCTNWTQGAYSEGGGSELAVAAWFDPRSRNVLDSTQVVRVFDSVAQAKSWVNNLRAMAVKCQEYRDGLVKPPGITTRTSFFAVPGRYGEQMVAWRQQADFGVSVTASTWHITARYGHVVSTVDSTSLDDVQHLAIRDVRGYADQAGRLIMAAIEEAG